MEDTILIRIKKCQFTKGQARIADYILKNQKRVVQMTLRETAAEIGISDASIVRFSRILGFDGYQEMKSFLAREQEREIKEISRENLETRFEIRRGKYHAEEMEIDNMLMLLGTNVETSLRQNSLPAYMRVADMIVGANEIVVIGLRGEKGCAIQFGRLLRHILPHVWTMTQESQDQLCELQKLGKNDLVIFLNCQRYYKIDKKIAEILHEKLVPCCVITDSLLSPAVKYAREVLMVETEQCGFFHSMVGFTGILEYILIVLCWKNPELVKESLQRREQVLIDDLL